MTIPSRATRIFHQAAGVVVLDADRCLVLRRGSEWVLPKGHLKDGQRPADAAVREVREETGLTVAVDQHVGATRYEFGQTDDAVHVKRVDWYRGHPVAGSLRPDPPFVEARFATLGEAVSMLTHDADRNIARCAYGLAADESAGSTGETAG